MSPTDKATDIIRRIYSTINDTQEWQQALAEISEYTESSHAFITARRGFAGEPVGFFDHGFETDYFLNYSEYFYQVDVWTQSLARFTPNRFHASHEVYADKDFVKSEIYSDFAKPSDIRHSVGCFVGDPHSDFTVELGFMRGHSQQQYNPEVIQRFDQFLPHIQHSLYLSEQMNQLKQQHDSLYAAFDQQQDAIFICRADATLCYQNKAAQAVLENSGLFKNNHQNRLMLKSNQQQQQFSEKIADCLSPLSIGNHTSAKKPKLKPPITPCCDLYFQNKQNDWFRLELAPWTQSPEVTWGYQQQPGFILFIRSQQQQKQTSTRAISQAFGLTQAEAAVCIELCRGKTSDRIANERGVSATTIRQQIKSSLKKLNCGSQVELVATLLKRTQ